MEMNVRFETGLIQSENFLEGGQSNNDMTEHLKKYTQRSTDSNKKDEAKSSELISILEASAATWNLDKINDISEGLKNLQFEYGLTEAQSDYEFLRSRSHIVYTTACAHAAFFVGIANRIRRDLDTIKKGYDTVQKTSLLLNAMKKEPGLQIGIIGGGKLGRQLAEAFLQFSKVFPNELQISSRQPDTLISLQKRGVRCYFDNAKIASSVNILFICVLPSQLPNVVDDIKIHLVDKCIVYNFVRTESPQHLKNLLGELNSKTNIIKPNHLININVADSELSRWDFSLDLVECLDSEEMLEMTNPFVNYDDTLMKIDEYFLASMMYGLFNICNYLNLTQKETFYAVKKFLFSSCKKAIKLEETVFFEKKTTQECYPLVDLVEASQKTTPLFYKIRTSKTFKYALNKCYMEYFDEIKRFRNSYV